VGGGQFKMIGNSAAPTVETIGTLNIGLSAGNLYGNSTVTLQANPAEPLTLNATAFGAIPIGSSSLVRGVSGVAGNGLANLNIGTLALGAPGGSGTGTNGSTVMPIRPDILGDSSVTGIGTAFLGTLHASLDAVFVPGKEPAKPVPAKPKRKRHK